MDRLRYAPQNCSRLQAELQTLQDLYAHLQHWLTERQHISTRAQDVWRLQAWLLNRYSKCLYDFLHIGYIQHSPEQVLALGKSLSHNRVF